MTDQCRNTIKPYDDTNRIKGHIVSAEKGGHRALNNPSFGKTAIGPIGEWYASVILKEWSFGWSICRLKEEPKIHVKRSKQNNLVHRIDNSLIEKNYLEWYYFTPDNEFQQLLLSTQSWDFLIINKKNFEENKKDFMKALHRYNFFNHHMRVLKNCIDYKITSDIHFLENFQYIMDDVSVSIKALENKKIDEIPRVSIQDMSRTTGTESLIYEKRKGLSNNSFYKNLKNIKKTKKEFLALKKCARQVHKKNLEGLRNEREIFNKQLRKLDPILLDIKTSVVSGKGNRKCDDNRIENIKNALEKGFKLEIMEIQIIKDQLSWLFREEPRTE
jgi:hypothetical protein